MTKRWTFTASVLCAAAVACAPAVPAAPAAPQAAQSILAGSTPAAGSSVSGPVDNLVLRFTPSARLGEVIVTGPDGTMPMMVDAVGELATFTVPTSGLGPGAYRVDWRATAAGREQRGSFAFTVR